MTNHEIFTKINANNKRIEELVNPAQFVLNTEIQKLIQENKELRTQCTHNFINGVCEFCGELEAK